MVYLFLADGFEESEAIVSYDVLKRGGVDVQTVGVTGKIITSAHGLSVNADITIEECPEEGEPPELIFLPGGMVGVNHLADSPKMVRIIHQAMQMDHSLAAICAAPKLLADLGYLEGRTVTCYPTFIPYIQSVGGIVRNDIPLIQDGNLITSQGVGTALVFAIYLLSILKTPEVAMRISEEIVYV